MDRHARPRHREIQALLHHRREIGLAQAYQTLVIAMEAPDILRMLEGPRKRVIESEICAVDRFGFLYVSLFKEQRA